MALPLSEIVALVTLGVALLLVAQALPWSRHGGGVTSAGDALLLDLLQGAGLQDLATRSNMILLCHAILIALLGNAGILTNNRCKNNAAASLMDLEEDPWAGTSLAAEPAAEHLLVHATTGSKEVVGLVEKQGTWRRTGLIHGHHLHLVVAAAAGEFHHQPAATADVKTVSLTDSETISAMDLDDDDHALVADQDKDGAEEESAEWQIIPEEEDDDGEEEDEEEDDLDEMNRRFEAFIAATKEKMRMEALQPAPENRAVLLAW